MNNERHESRNKNILIGALLAVILIMGVGYAAFAQQLTINGTASISSNWSVYIESIEGTVSVSTTANGKTTSAGTPSHDGTTATFEATLVSPEDTVVYTVTVKNNGTIDAKLADINLYVGNNQESLTLQEDLTATGSEDAIVYTVQSLTEDETLEAGGTKTFTVTVTYNANITQQPETTELTQYAKLTLDYEQATD